MSALTWSLTLSLLLKATLMVLLAITLCAVLKRSSAATRHLLLTLARVGLIALPLLSLGLPSWRLEVLKSEPSNAKNAHLKSPTQWSESEASSPAGLEPLPALSNRMDSQREATSKPLQSSAVGPISFSGHQLTRILIWVWALGALLLLSRVATGMVRMGWIVRRAASIDPATEIQLLDTCRAALGLELRPSLVVSDYVDVPVVWGWKRPVLVMPRGFLSWSPERVRAVLLHELGHLRRGDWPVLLLGRLVSALYWFHPLIWSLERRAHRECECACDDLVVRCGMKPSDYATHLLSIADHLHGSPARPRAALALIGKSELAGRVRSILDPRSRRREPSRRMVTSSAGLLLAVLIPLASLQLVPKTSAAPQQSDEMTFGEMEGKAGGNGERWYELAYKMHAQSRWQESATAFERAAELDYRPATALYNAACAQARLGNAPMALERLEQAWDAGFGDLGLLTKDSDLHAIRSDNGFQAFVDRAFKRANRTRNPSRDYPLRSAIEHFESLRSESSTNPAEWRKVGTQLLYLRQFDPSIAALSAAVEHGAGTTAMYNLACAHSLAGDERSALDWLDRTVEAGFGSNERLVNDSDLDSLRGNSRFDKISTKSKVLDLGQYSDHGLNKSDYSERRWAPAIEAYRAFVSENPNSGRGQFNLGWALHYSNRFDEGVEAFEKALELGYRPSLTAYNIACAQAKQGRTDSAFSWLDRAVSEGFQNPGHLRRDEDLVSLWSDSRFDELLNRVEDLRPEK